MSIKSSAEFFKIMFSGFPEYAEFAVKNSEFFDKFGDDLMRAMRKSPDNMAGALEESLKNADNMSDGAKAFFRRPSTVQLFENLAASKPFLDEFSDIYRQAATKGTKISDKDFIELLKKHKISEDDTRPGIAQLARLAKQAQKGINEAAESEISAQSTARGRYFGNSNWYVGADAAARHAENPLARTGFRAAAGSVRVARAGVPVGIVGLIAGVGAHAVTDGKSTELAVDALDATLMTTVKAIRVVSPALADLLEKTGKEGMIFLLKFSDQKADASEKAVRRFAERHNYAITDREAKSAGHILGGSFIQAAFVAVTGKDIDLGEAAKILEAADAAPDRAAFIKQEFKTRFGVSDEEADAIIQRAESLKPEVKAAVEQIKTGDVKATVEGVKDKFEGAADAINPVEKFGIIGGAVYSLCLMSFKAGPKTAEWVAGACQTMSSRMPEIMLA